MSRQYAKSKSVGTHSIANDQYAAQAAAAIAAEPERVSVPREVLEDWAECLSAEGASFQDLMVVAAIEKILG